jgi:twitching motility protein PilT
MAEIDLLLQHLAKVQASDLHIRVGMKPRLRVAGTLQLAKDFPPLNEDDVQRLMMEILNEEQREHFRQQHELDFTHGTEHARFRCNYFRDNWGPGAVFRGIPAEVPGLAALNLPPELDQFAHARRGLVLVTGSSASGKSSTLAALVDILNESYHRHVITLEDPIEYIHRDKLGVIHQRGLHEDFASFESGILDAMRQDPEVLVIGELRDLESMRRALTAAETGILVFATLHTNGAAESIDRIIDAFPSHEQTQVRVQLSESLAGIVSQVLLHRIDGAGRVPATEVLVATPALASIIREGKTQDIANVIQSGRTRGMHTLEDSLESLVKRRIVDAKEAYLFARNKARFDSVAAS